MPKVTEELVSFAVDLEYGAIPDEVVGVAKLSILDGLGTALLAVDHEKSRKIAKALIPVSPGNSTVWGYRRGASQLTAAMINGMLVEGLGCGDISVEAGLHPTGVILPAVLTYGEAAGKTGKDVLTAYILGSEVMVRLGMSGHRESQSSSIFHARGFQPTSIIGVLGAALAVGKMMGLGRVQMLNALSLATGLAFGSPLSVRAGAYYGGLDPGRAAEAGLLSALLAGNGVTGIALDSLEGKFGFLEVYAGPGAYNVDKITRGLSKTWGMKDVFWKRYPTSYACTRVLDAAMRIHGMMKGRRASTIKKVRFGESKHNIKLFTEPLPQKRRPLSIYDAETSYFFLLAAALARGKVTVQTLRRFQDKTLLRVADSILAVPDEGAPWVEVEFQDGVVIREAQDELLQTTEGQLRAKFFENSRLALGNERAVLVERKVGSLDRLDEIRRLTRLLKR